MLKKLVFMAALLGLLGGSHNTSTVEAVELDCYKTLELVLDQATSTPSNPFDTYSLRVEVTNPVETKFEIDGFYDGDGRLRHNLWANLTSGAAGGGTGSNLETLQRFMEQSDMPFQRMTPNNELVTSGGIMSFALAETGQLW